MLRLAVANRAETFDRMVDPLSERGIEAVTCTRSGTTSRLTGESGTDVDVGFVFPGRITEGGVLDAVLDVPWVNDREAVLTSRNKAAVLAHCARAELPVPETVLVSNPSDDPDLRAAFDRLEPPIVVKPTTTTRGTGVTKVYDYDSLLGVVDYLDAIHEFPATGDKSYLLQEYLPDARDLRVMVIDGEYAGAVRRRVPEEARETGRWKHNVHRGAEATGVDLGESHRRLAERVAQELEIPLLGVDLLATEDRTVVSETNARPTIDESSKYQPGFYDRLADTIERTARGPDPA
jgi:ribosomal protein S6--L-glutamate ligase